MTDLRKDMILQLVASLADEAQKSDEKFSVKSYLLGLADAWVFLAGRDEAAADAFRITFIDLLGMRNAEKNAPSKADLRALIDSATLVWDDIVAAKRDHKRKLS